MKERQESFDFENSEEKIPAEPKLKEGERPYKSQKEKLEETREMIKATNKKRGIKAGIQPLDPKTIDGEKSKYPNER